MSKAKKEPRSIYVVESKQTIGAHWGIEYVHRHQTKAVSFAKTLGELFRPSNVRIAKFVEALPPSKRKGGAK